ncbi:MAG: LSU ribosomal protein L10P [Methanomicrobiales archaeon 53_19]|jgi:large subunit ribosomal protein L10|uniref:50S ribosomal protein L10 n=1 Tax=Methanocalculus sp. TaxID=2004547 RepID=UPI000749AC5A|nr:50S ribosomal protein L10 [Methanocalculus sp.]KUL03305.1 MAG: LSU ribosomal protein L10P [Methanomicrobiales archaeon 53_19]HIJ07068.1 50S ribosomal protein L10 [Methanocalculus sp.]
MAVYTRHLPQWKQDEVEEVKKNVQEYALLGIIDTFGIPASQFQQIRRNLKERATIKVMRNTLIEHAFSDLGGVYDDLKEHITGHSALIFTNDNPFRLFKSLEQTKTKRAAKAGEIAPEDIVVPKGATSFKPGPIVSELQQAGIPATIDGGKVKIRETKTVVKAGEVIDRKKAGVLSKLDIKPMDVGLSLFVALYQDELYLPDVLGIDETEYYNKLVLAVQQAFNLSVNAVYPTAFTMETILAKAFREARSLGIEAAIYEKDVIDGIIAKAYRQMNTIKVLVE